MFQNAAIDVAIALILLYSMLSLLCTVINEFIATKLRMRATMLKSALEQLLDDKTLYNRFYRHGLIVTSQRATTVGVQSIPSVLMSGLKKIMSMMRGTQTVTAAPSLAPAATSSVATAQTPTPEEDHPAYLSGRTVALALIGSLDPEKPVPAIGDISTAIQNLSAASHIRSALLSSLTEAGADLDKLRTSIATWFDDSMERLSGAYKRQQKWICLLIAGVVTFAFNADTFNVASVLWSDQDRRAAAVAVATKVAQESHPKPNAPVDTDMKNTIKTTETNLRSLPIGWSCEVPGAGPTTSQQATLGYWDCIKTNLSGVSLIQVAGWILTVAALSLGAPFWFDLLQKFVHIRGTGLKPKREDEKSSA